MKKTLKRILLVSGFVIGTTLVGTSFYMAKQETSYKAYAPVKIAGLFTLAGVVGFGIRPLINEERKNDNYKNGE